VHRQPLLRDAGGGGPGRERDPAAGLHRREVPRHQCACFTPNKGRIEDVIRLAKETKADGIVHYALQFCAPYQIEAYSVEKAAEEAGIPVLRIDTDYSMEDLGQLKTRVEAFLEMLEPASDVA
jgi:benzoyl-CoA reductase/2-hydroxyglutaryl-CoA dehydratase subunit BcrC/BadD/HgdB